MKRLRPSLIIPRTTCDGAGQIPPGQTTLVGLEVQTAKSVAATLPEKQNEIARDTDKISRPALAAQ